MKIVFFVPHFFTQKISQYTYWLIKELLDKTLLEVILIEYDSISSFFSVEREELKMLLKQNFLSLDKENKEKNLLKIIDEINPDVLHLQENPELWLSKSIINKLYFVNRYYKIIETPYDLDLKSKQKFFLPDFFVFIDNRYSNIYSVYDLPYKIIEFGKKYMKKIKRLVYKIETEDLIDVGCEEMLLAVEAARRLDLPIYFVVFDEKLFKVCLEKYDFNYDKLFMIREGAYTQEIINTYDFKDIFLDLSGKESFRSSPIILNLLSKGNYIITVKEIFPSTEGIIFVKKNVNNIVYEIKKIMTRYEEK